jgi:hypothetical protein
MRRRATAAAFVLFLGVLTVVSWRKWGNPELDPGADLTLAALIADEGTVPYDDVRYFYGPAGLYALAGAFQLAGASFTTAFVFGYLQTLAILGLFYVLARTWLRPLTAVLATAVLAAIGFSGTLFNFVLPHTNSATFGLLFLLAELLAIARGRTLLAGFFIGACALTRPEFLAVAAVAGAGAVAGRARERGARAAGADALRLALPAVAVGGVVLGAFAAVAGAHRLFFENLIPLDFTRVSGAKFQENWAPFTIESVVATIARGAAWLVPLAGLVATVARLGERPRPSLARAVVPLAASLAALAVAFGLWRLSGAFPGTRGAVEDDITRLLIAMSWLPVAAFAGVVLALLALFRREQPPFGATFPADIALAAAAGALALRAYNDFTTDIYATYYAAGPLLVAAIGYERLGDRRPEARPALAAALALAAAMLAVHAYVGLYRDNNTEVRTARGGYVANDQAAPAIQRTVDLVRSRSGPNQPILVLPDDPGIHFMTNRPPALYEQTFLPGTLDSREDELEAIARLERTRPPLVVIGARRFDQYGKPVIGEDFNRTLVRYLRRAYRVLAEFGDVDNPPSGSMPSEAFTVLERRTIAP